MAKDKRRSPGKGTSGQYRSSKPTSKGQRGSRGGKPYPPKKGRSAATDRSEPAKRRRDLKGAAVDLPNWVIEALARVTPDDRVGPALEALGEASAAMADGRYHAAVKHAKKAKNLAPQDATVRETLGLSAYRIGDWDTALSELRAYRRMAGDATHLPIEMDVLRALERDRDVEKAWETLKTADVPPTVWKEGKVVYGTYLLEQGDPEAAWDLTGPDRVGPNANDADLRVWYVAARAAASNGDTTTARRIADAIVLNDPSFAGLDALDQEIIKRS
jgi:predicted Zn-dependent protease